MLRNLGGGVRPDLGIIIICTVISTVMFTVISTLSLVSYLLSYLLSSVISTVNTLYHCPHLADMVLWISTRLPMLFMERLEAELVRDRRPPPT